MKCSCCNKEIKGKFYRTLDKLYCQDCTQTQTQYRFGNTITDWVDGHMVNTFNDKEDYIVWLKSVIKDYEDRCGDAVRVRKNQNYVEGSFASCFEIDHRLLRICRDYIEKFQEELNKVINEC